MYAYISIYFWVFNKNEETCLDRPLRWKDWQRFCVFRGQQRQELIRRWDSERELFLQHRTRYSMVFSLFIFDFRHFFR